MNLAVLYVAVPQAETMGHIGMLFVFFTQKQHAYALLKIMAILREIIAMEL